tara:strand:+ start:10741 stop:11172 length:432 start_codon:yes stop_codon:yes gene_type:complete
MPISKQALSRGFTMIELLTVITIMSLLITLVGPTSINFLAKAQAQAEFIQLKNDLKKISYLSFVSATVHQIDFNQNQGSVIKNQKKTTTLRYEHISFAQQQVRFNSRGYPSPEILMVNFANKSKEINLFKLVEGVDAKITSAN